MRQHWAIFVDITERCDKLKVSNKRQTAAGKQDLGGKKMKFELNGVEVVPSGAEGFISALAGVLLTTAIVVALFAIVLYVIKSLGLYAIAKRRGIACAWLVWLPVGCEWITASIADQYRKVTRGKATIRRFIILVLAVASIGMSVVATTNFADSAEGIQELAEYTASFGEYMDEEDALVVLEEMGEVLGSFTLMTALAGVIGFVSQVYWFVSVGDVYASCCPKNATMMLVLSFFMPVLEPFFFFCNKEKDAGMVPVSKPQPQYVAPIEPAAPVYEAPAQQPVYEAPAEPVQTPVEPWAASDTRPEPWENPEN
jgi:hypothetical protein